MAQTATNRGTVLGAVNFTGIYNSTDGEYGLTPLGTMVKGSDGHDYLYVQASTGVATGDPSALAVVVTEPGMTIAAGAGIWQYRGVPALTTGQRCWVQRIAL